jgi:acyl carrier protein
MEEIVTIQTSLERFIKDELLVGAKNTTLTPETSLISSGIIDSLSLIRLINFIESHFGVTIEDHEVVVENFETLNNLATLIASKQ